MDQHYNIKHKASGLLKHSLYSIPEFTKKEISKKSAKGAGKFKRDLVGSTHGMRELRISDISAKLFNTQKTREADYYFEKFFSAPTITPYETTIGGLRGLYIAESPKDKNAYVIGSLKY